jgi:hypothetical protein
MIKKTFSTFFMSLVLSVLASAQSTDYDFINGISSPDCKPFQTSPSAFLSPWQPSHGTPHLVDPYGQHNYYIAGLSTDYVTSSQGEGLYINYTFDPTHTYTIYIQYSTPSSNPCGVSVNFADGLIPATATDCGTDVVPTDGITSQEIYNNNSIPSTPTSIYYKTLPVNSNVKPNSAYSQLWIYTFQSFYSTSSSVQISKVTIVDNCGGFSLSVSPSNSTICQNATTPAALTANISGYNPGTITYSWSPTTALNSSTAKSVNALPTQTTTYTVKASSSNGCAPLSKTVTVNVAPVTNLPDIAIYKDAPAIQVSGSPAGGTWTGSGITPAGVFTASSATIGSDVMTYSVSGCPAQTQTIKVKSLVSGAKSLTFDGINDFAYVPDSRSYDIGTGDFTFESWVNMPSNAPSNNPIISSMGTDNNNGFIFEVSNAGKNLSILMGNRFTGLVVQSTSKPFTSSIYDGSCHHVAVTKLNGVISFYLDGVNFSISNDLNCVNGNATNGQGLEIGSTGTIIYSSIFKGTIDDIRLWNVARSQANLVANMTQNLPGNSPGLIAYFTMGDGGQILHDLSITANNGMLIYNPLTALLVSNSFNPVYSTTACFTSATNTGLYFNGNCTLASINTLYTFDNVGTGDFTLESLVSMPANSPSINPVVTNMGTDNNDGFIFEVSNTGKSLSILMGNRSTGLVVQSTSKLFTSSIYDGNCHHIAVTKLKGVISFYLDGVNFSNSNDLNCAAGNISGSGTYEIGSTGTNIYPYCFKGTINDLRLWNVSRTALQISSNMYQNLATNPNLLGYYRFNESTSSQIIIDASGNNYNGILGWSAGVDQMDPSRTTVTCYSADRLASGDAFTTVSDAAVSPISIYPNPTENVFTINILASDTLQNYVINIIDLTGNTIYASTATSDSKTVLGESLMSGIYLVKIISSNGDIKIEKIIKY